MVLGNAEHLFATLLTGDLGDDFCGTRGGGVFVVGTLAIDALAVLPTFTRSLGSAWM